MSVSIEKLWKVTKTALGNTNAPLIKGWKKLSAEERAQITTTFAARGVNVIESPNGAYAELDESISFEAFFNEKE